MTNKILIGPFYWITDEQLSLAGTKGRFIITDDASPLFPIDMRELAIERCTMLKDLLIDTIHEHEEHEDFADSIKRALKNFDLEDAEIHIWMDGEEAPELDAPVVKHTLGELPKNLSEMGLTFASRFGKYFLNRLEPIVSKPFVMKGPITVTPFYKEGENIFLGTIYEYDGFKEPHNCLLAFDSAELSTLKHSELADELIKNTCSAFWLNRLGAKFRYLGDNNYSLEVEKPAWIVDGVNGNRRIYKADQDVSFVNGKLLSGESLLLYWIYDQIKKLDEE